MGIKRHRAGSSRLCPMCYNTKMFFLSAAAIPAGIKPREGTGAGRCPFPVSRCPLSVVRCPVPGSEPFAGKEERYEDGDGY